MKAATAFGVILAILFGMAACTKETKPPANVLQQEEMVEILTDMHLADAIIDEQQIGRDSIYHYSKAYYQQIWANHATTEEEFMKSFAFYESEPQLLDRLYENVLAKLSVMEAEMSQ